MDGFSYGWLDYPVEYLATRLVSQNRSEQSLSPKAGFIWTPARDTVVRFAYTRSWVGVSSLDESYRLEPVQLAGINQAYGSLIPAGPASGAKFETFGLALEQKFDTGTYLGVEGDLLDSAANRVIGAEDAFFSF